MSTTTTAYDVPALVAGLEWFAAAGCWDHSAPATCLTVADSHDDDPDTCLACVARSVLDRAAKIAADTARVAA